MVERGGRERTRLWEGWSTFLDSAEEKSFLERIYPDMPRNSIDYAVMAKTQNAWVYPAKFNWADIGNWDSLYEYMAHHDSEGNAMNLVNKGLVKECRDNIVYSVNPGKLIALRGLENFIVIDTDDVLMICPRNEEKLKDTLSTLAMSSFEEYR